MSESPAVDPHAHEEHVGLNEEILRYLEQERMRLGLQPEQMRILDYGCGRGEAVEGLLAKGYEALGVDISEVSVTIGKERFAELGLNPERLSLLNDDGSMPYEDDAFDFIYSYQVLEHVEDIDKVCAELARVTRPGALGFHIYPSRHRVVEGHLFMPVVHWLPKNNLRKWLVKFWTSIGVEPHWPQLEERTVDEKTDVYYAYSRDETYYRGVSEVSRAFENQGFSTGLNVVEHPRVQDHSVLGPLARSGATSGLLEWAICEFQTVQLTTTHQV